ncbi:hypothetical protein D3C87_1523740 [compost metagenome]
MEDRDACLATAVLRRHPVEHLVKITAVRELGQVIMHGTVLDPVLGCLQFDVSGFGQNSGTLQFMMQPDIICDIPVRTNRHLVTVPILKGHGARANDAIGAIAENGAVLIRKAVAVSHMFIDVFQDTFAIGRMQKGFPQSADPDIFAPTDSIDAIHAVIPVDDTGCEVTFVSADA